MGCTAKCAKFLIVLVNAIVLIGMAIGVGVSWNQLKTTDVQKFQQLITKNKLFAALACVIAFIAISSLIGFSLLCCSPKWYRIIYFFFLFVAFAVEVVAVAFASKQYTVIVDTIGDNWNKEDYNSSVDYVEKTLKCCSFNNKTYQENKESCHYMEYNGTFCENKITDMVKDNMDKVKIAVIVLVVFEVILFLLTFYWACCFKEDDEVDDITKTQLA